LELHLPQSEPWTLRDVTADILKTGEETLTQGKRAKDERQHTAVEALSALVRAREETGHPLNKTEAEEFLCEKHNLKRAEARPLLGNDNFPWRLESRRHGDGKQAGWWLLTKNDGDGDDTKIPHSTRPSGAPFVAEYHESGRRRQSSEDANIHAVYRDTYSSPTSDPVHPFQGTEESSYETHFVAVRSESERQRIPSLQTAINKGLEDTHSSPTLDKGRQRQMSLETTTSKGCSDTQFVADEKVSRENCLGNGEEVF
jgi:hypothetical protein